MENFILNGDFFNSPIVRVPEGKPEAAMFTGSNQKKILIVSMMEGTNQPPDIAFLKKIFESVSINLETDTSLFVLTQNTEFNWPGITKSTEFEQLIFFGNSPKKIGLHFDHERYKIFTHLQRRFLIAESLDLIASDRSKKGALWTALKEMFLK